MSRLFVLGIPFFINCLALLFANSSISSFFLPIPTFYLFIILRTDCDFSFFIIVKSVWKNFVVSRKTKSLFTLRNLCVNQIYSAQLISDCSVVSHSNAQLRHFGRNHNKSQEFIKSLILNSADSAPRFICFLYLNK